MNEHQRLTKINTELNKLSSIIEMTKSQDQAVLQILKNCQHSTPSSSSSVIIDENNTSHNISQMFEGTNSKDTVFIPEGNWTDSFDFNECSSIINSNTKKQTNKMSNLFQQTHLSDDTAKEQQKRTLHTKSTLTGVKKSKLMKSNLPKNKNNFFEKDKVLYEQEKTGKLTRIKSQKKFLNNNKSSLKYSLNLQQINEQKTVGLKKQKNVKCNLQHTQNLQTLQNQKIYVSSKIETLNSKRSKPKHDSMAAKQRVLHQRDTMRNSNHKYQIELQKEVNSKINGLKMRKNLCQIEASYLTASMRITKEEIERVVMCEREGGEENLIRFFLLKAIMKFIFQVKNQTSLAFEPLETNENRTQQTSKKCQKLIKLINKLPDFLRKNEQISEFTFKQLTQQKLFIEQKICKIASKFLTKEPLYTFLQELYQYIDFLVKNQLISLGKKEEGRCPEGFFSDRSAKPQKQRGNVMKENQIFAAKKKEFSERKKEQTVALKRVNTVKVLKKSTTTVKQRLV